MYAATVTATNRAPRDGVSTVVTDVTRADSALIVLAPRAPRASVNGAVALAKSGETYGTGTVCPGRA